MSSHLNTFKLESCLSNMPLRKRIQPYFIQNILGLDPYKVRAI